MIKFRTKNKAFALRKTGAAALITAALLTLVPVFIGCPNNAGGNKPGGSGENPSTPPSETAILTLDAGKLNIIVKAKTADGSDIQVEGCDEATLKSDKAAELHAKGTIVTLKSLSATTISWSPSMCKAVPLCKSFYAVKISSPALMCKVAQL